MTCSMEQAQACVPGVPRAPSTQGRGVTKREKYKAKLEEASNGILRGLEVWVIFPVPSMCPI